MAVSALEALFETLKDYLVGDGSQLWGSRVVPTEVAASGIDYPYVSFFWSGGGSEPLAAWLDGERFTLTIKGVCGMGAGISSPMAVAMAMDAAISELLRDSGEQDYNSRFGVHSEWRFLTVTRGAIVSMRVQLGDEKWSYHQGHQYSFLMERK